MASQGVEVIETTLLNGQVKLLQPKHGFHASLDTVFLSAAATPKMHDKVLDIGCGVGSAGLCVALRNKNITLTGIDIQGELIDIALQNATLNGMAERCRFFEGSVLTDKAVEDNFFDIAIMNPPYHEAGTHTASPQRIKAMSHGEEASGATLTDWVKYAHRKLKQGGTLALIHRADRLDDVIVALAARRWFGSLRVLPLCAHEGENAHRIIVVARKERYKPIILMNNFIIHIKKTGYTSDAKKILEDGETLTF